MTTAEIRTEAELQACVGKVPGPRDAKVIHCIDEGASRWLAASPLAFLAVGRRDGSVCATLAGGAAGFAKSPQPGILAIPQALLDGPELFTEGLGVGCLFLVPSLGETLRINGRVMGRADSVGSEPEQMLEIAVEECYMHCAKALIRSSFWAGLGHGDESSSAMDLAMNTPQDWLAASRFLALATVDEKGHADLSPKGDPAGLLIKPLADGSFAFAERPGNRRTDSFLNILSQPRMAALALVPGLSQVVVLEGRARLSTDEMLCDDFTVNGKQPRLVTRVEPSHLILRRSMALSRARLWPAPSAPQGLKPSDLFAAHIRASHHIPGVGGWVAKAAVSIPGLMQKGLEQDYKKNLY